MEPGAARAHLLPRRFEAGAAESFGATPKPFYGSHQENGKSDQDGGNRRDHRADFLAHAAAHMTRQRLGPVPSINSIRPRDLGFVQELGVHVRVAHID